MRRRRERCTARNQVFEDFARSLTKAHNNSQQGTHCLSLVCFLHELSRYFSRLDTSKGGVPTSHYHNGRAIILTNKREELILVRLGSRSRILQNSNELHRTVFNLQEHK